MEIWRTRLPLLELSSHDDLATMAMLLNDVKNPILRICSYKLAVCKLWIIYTKSYKNKVATPEWTAHFQWSFKVVDIRIFSVKHKQHFDAVKTFIATGRVIGWSLRLHTAYMTLQSSLMQVSAPKELTIQDWLCKIMERVSNSSEQIQFHILKVD